MIPGRIIPKFKAHGDDLSMEVNHPDHTLITYPGLGHTFLSIKELDSTSGANRRECAGGFAFMVDQPNEESEVYSLLTWAYVLDSRAPRSIPARSRGWIETVVFRISRRRHCLRGCQENMECSHAFPYELFVLI